MNPADDAQPYTIPEHRNPCPRCGRRDGVIYLRNGQNVVRCGNRDCPSYSQFTGFGERLYCAPKSETGQEPRKVGRDSAVPPKVRLRVIEACGMRCFACGRGPEHGVILNVSHILSVKDGLALGVQQHELDHDDNLTTLCEECNLGQGSASFSPRLYVRLLSIAAKKRGESDTPASDP